LRLRSAKRNDRPELEKALAACKKHRAKLVIAKLDRLSRNRASIANADGPQCRLHCCDNPTATKFTIHILAAVAEHERDAISARTKAALAAAEANGKKLGNYQRIAAAEQRATGACAEAVGGPIAETAYVSMRAAAGTMNPRGITTASGKQWHPMQVHRARQRLGREIALSYNVDHSTICRLKARYAAEV
jgi:cobalamin biosynthesis Mg chelatase CobN